jgi:Cu/Ag efflux protein CusF
LSIRRAFAVAASVALLSAPLPSRAEDTRMAIHPQATPVITLDRTDEPGVVAGKFQDAMTANVKSVDLARRQVTLSAGARVETMTAGPEVKNLEKLQRGDRVEIRFRAGLVLRLQVGDAGGDAPEVEKEIQNTGRGDLLSGTETVRARLTVTVKAIDPATKVVTLEDADRRTYRVKAGEGVTLERVKVGDRFRATYSAAMAVSVKPVYRD